VAPSRTRCTVVVTVNHRQLYLAMRVDNTPARLSVLAQCTTDVRQWYLQNGLQLKPDKSKALIIRTQMLACPWSTIAMLCCTALQATSSRSYSVCWTTQLESYSRRQDDHTQRLPVQQRIEYKKWLCRCSKSYMIPGLSNSGNFDDLECSSRSCKPFQIGFFRTVVHTLIRFQLPLRVAQSSCDTCASCLPRWTCIGLYLWKESTLASLQR